MIIDKKDKYTVYVGYEFEVEDNIYPLMDEAYPITNYRPNRVISYHGGKDSTGHGLWRIEQDASLRNGAEFISPPMPMEDSFEMMRKFFRAITEAGSVTSTRCGCHTNICLTYNGRILKINETALLCNIDWRLLCSLWPNRLKTNNVFCKYINQILKENDKILNIKDKNKLAGFLFTHYHSFISRKESSWNKKGVYYELRFPGGEDYHLYPEKIETTVRYFNDVLNKSRSAICKTQNKNHNRKIISYINRKVDYSINVPFFAGSLKQNLANISKLKNIKHLIKLNNKMLAYSLLSTIILDINYIQKTTQNTRPPFYRPEHIKESKEFITDLVKIINKKNILYHMYKICFVYIRETGNEGSSVLGGLTLLLKMDGIEFTIPEDEQDLHKLWLIRYLYVLPKQTKSVLVKSMKSNRVKNLLNKLIQNDRYLEPKFCKFINNISTEPSKNDERNVKR